MKSNTLYFADINVDVIDLLDKVTTLSTRLI